MRRTKFGFLCLVLIITLCLCCACTARNARQDGIAYRIYYVSNDETKIVEREYVSETTDTEALLLEMLGQLAAVPEKMEYETPLAAEISVIGHTLDSGLLTLDFDKNYKSLYGIREILLRASVVRTVTQLPGVERVAFTVEGEQLTDKPGTAVGIMAADTFIENAGNEINAYEKVNLRLYFANEKGDRLVEENRRNVVYNSNISLEKLVVEKLVEGPAVTGAYPTINPATKIISVTVQDGTCYVNLNNDFLSQPYNVLSDVTIYSITNSLVELPNVNRVQISIDGETNLSYRENMSLNTVYERNLDLLESGTAQ